MVSCIAGLLLALVLAGSAPAGPVEIRILHVNDFHGFAEPHQPLGAEETVGGAAFLAARAHALRLEKASLLLAAGDMIQGHNWANLFQGESVVALMNAMGFDAMVVGNHEFDFGREALRRRIAQARFPVLGANVDGVGGLRPYVIWEVQGARVAVVGVVTQDTPVATHPRNVAGLTFRPALEALRWQVRALRDQADLVVVLSHCGYQADRVLAAAVPGVDVIVGGHSHTRLEHPVAVGRTLIVQAWEHGKALGVLDLTVENGRVVRHEGRLEAIKPGLAPADPSIQALVAGFTGRVDAALSQPVAQALVDLDGERVRERETNFGNLVADIMRTVSGADATIINGGGIRTSIRQGDVSAKHVYAALPFDNYIVAFRLTGRQIRAALEHGVSGVQEGAGRFPQVSGLAFTFSRSAPRGQRVREVLVGGRPLDLQREYTVATNDFLAAGGDGYRAFGEAMAASRDYAVVGGAMQGERLVYNDAGRWLRDVVIERMREMGRLSPRVEGRITEVP
jgi:2',3'-cyclic-nucleotide 2'-phosphodiesterase (5'-nucleotidase family)